MSRHTIWLWYSYPHYSCSAGEWWQLCLCQSQVCWCSTEPTISCQESLRTQRCTDFPASALYNRQIEKLDGSVSK